MKSKDGFTNLSENMQSVVDSLYRSRRLSISWIDRRTLNALERRGIVEVNGAFAQLTPEYVDVAVDGNWQQTGRYSMCPNCGQYQMDILIDDWSHCPVCRVWRKVK